MFSNFNIFLRIFQLQICGQCCWSASGKLEQEERCGSVERRPFPCPYFPLTAGLEANLLAHMKRHDSTPNDWKKAARRVKREPDHAGNFSKRRSMKLDESQSPAGEQSQSESQEEKDDPPTSKLPLLRKKKPTSKLMTLQRPTGSKLKPIRRKISPVSKLKPIHRNISPVSKLQPIRREKSPVGKFQPTRKMLRLK